MRLAFLIKRLVILTAIAAAFCSCERNPAGEVVYTAEELGVYVEWGRSGWSEVFNETGRTVTLETTYPDIDNAGKKRELTSVIAPGEFIKLDHGAFMPGVSIDESLTASVKWDDGTVILCTRGADNAWSRHFYGSFEEREEYEIVPLADGRKVRHDLVVRTFHIDRTLVELWQAGQENLKQ